MQNSSIRICNADDSSLSIHNGMRTSCLHLLWGLGVIHLCMDHVKADFFSVIGHTSIHQAVDRHGMTDRMSLQIY